MPITAAAEHLTFKLMLILILLLIRSWHHSVYSFVSFNGRRKDLDEPEAIITNECYVFNSLFVIIPLFLRKVSRNGDADWKATVKEGY